MNYRKLTQIIIGVLVLVIAFYDVVVIQIGGTTASISARMIDWSKEFPVFSFGMGFISGHIFWPTRKYK